MPLGNESIDPSVAGMDLRDYFAGEALQGICASGPGKSFTNRAIAFEAYSLADAMLAERNKP